MDDKRNSINDEPSTINYFNNGQIESQYWFIDNNLDRKNGPAVINYNEFGKKIRQVWYKNGKYHNEFGPAEICDDDFRYTPNEYFYIDGKFFSQKSKLFIDLKYKLLNNKININRYKNLNNLKLLSAIACRFIPNNIELMQQIRERIDNLEIIKELST